MVCPNCGKTVTDDSMQFCPSCGFSFTQQPNQQYQPSQYGPQPYGQPGYPRKSGAIAVILSFFFAGLGQLYVGKIKRGIAFIVTFVILSVFSSVLTLNIDYNDINAVRGLLADGTFIIVILVSLGFWAYNIYDAYRQARKYNDASMRNDLARFLKGF
ncbi:MAG TPA: TM2 domain-containing protein [Methanomassiliicoccales archaeon]